MSQQSSRVLFVVNHAAFFLSHRLPLAEAARATGFDVHVATSVPATDRDIQAGLTIRNRGFPFHSVRLSRSGMNPLTEATTIAHLARLYKSLSPAIVHHVTMKPVVYGTYTATKMRVPAVVNAVSGLGFAFLDRSRAGQARRQVLQVLLRTALRHKCMRVIFQNDDDAAVFLRLGVVSHDQVRLIRGSGVDTLRFSPAAAPPGQPIVMLASRMLKDKGVLEFVAAARLIRSRGAAARFVLVGDPDENRSGIDASTLEEWATDGVVEWWGHRPDMAMAMREATIVVLPSYREGLPKVLLEAAACGKPVVTTDVPGCRDAVEVNRTALLVPKKDPIQLASAIERLLADAVMRERFGDAARRMALGKFSVERICEETLQVYRELIAISPKTN